MKQLSKLRWTLILLNALLIGIITFFSILISGGTDFRAILPAALIGAILKAIIELQGEVEHELETVKSANKTKAAEHNNKKSTNLVKNLLF